MCTQIMVYKPIRYHLWQSEVDRKQHMTSTSSYGISVRRKSQQHIQAPVGITILAGIGILAGLGMAILTLINVFLLTQQEMTSPYTIMLNLAIGLALALIMVWVNWGLLDLMNWAWWLYVILGVTGMLAGIVTIGFTPVVTPLLAEFLPRSIEPVLMEKSVLISAAIVALALNACVSIYLISNYPKFHSDPRRRR